jgi:Ca-activated chloride channel family protein
MKPWINIVAGLLLSGLCVAQSAPPVEPKRPAPPAPQSQETDSQDDTQTFRVNVKLVNIFTTVTDENGAPIGGLKKDDFTVYEDGELQKIAIFDRQSGLPLSIVLQIDSSLSTRKDLPLELESARRFAQTILRPVDAMSIYQFSDIVDEVQGFTSNLRTLDRAIGRVQASGATAVFDAVYLGAQALSKREGRKVLVIITDGGDTASHVDYGEALRAAQISEAIVYPIIMVPIEASAGRETGGEHALIQMSRDTGGRFYYASSIRQLDQAFREISDELRTQYLLAYYPPKSAHGDFRRLKVEVKSSAAPDTEMRARYRAGYYTSKID